ncbi:MAG: C39 family peptidase [Oscillospiraceae bacterium]|nr:C39 family peptidase [Oscillospiraceae bacterium]
MKRFADSCGKAAFLTVPLFAMLLTSCGEPIIKEESAPAILITTTVPETTVEQTTTMTVDPAWQENALSNYAGMGGNVIQNVNHYTQFDSYFTACESIAAVTLMQYFGIKITLDEFIDNYLPMTDYPAQGADGALHGESPYDYFIGNPRDAAGFGCYSTAIANGINKIHEGLAIPLKDMTLDEICKEYIDKGQPVELWGTIGMAAPYTSEFHWTLPNGERYDFVNPEHAVVLIGYDDINYYFSDSMSHTAITAYDKAAVETAYKGLFSQAVAIDPIVLESLPQSMRNKPAAGESTVTEAAIPETAGGYLQ